MSRYRRDQTFRGPIAATTAAAPWARHMSVAGRSGRPGTQASSAPLTAGSGRGDDRVPARGIRLMVPAKQRPALATKGTVAVAADRLAHPSAVGVRSGPAGAACS